MPPLYVSDLPISCINAAASEFHVPAKLIIAVLNVERGKTGFMMKNKNGTYDMGPLQVNSRWLPTLERYGYSENDIVFDGCTNVKVATWLLARAITHNSQSFWNAVGDYHSHTPDLNRSYNQKVKYYLNNIEMISS